MKQSTNKDILRHLNARPIAYYPIYHKITGSLHGAVILSQLMYWLSKKDKIYKTNKELMEELGFTERELKTAKNALKKATFIIVTREGLPAKTYYEIDWDEYEKVLNYISSAEDETVQATYDETVPTVEDETVPTLLYTENTTENTTEKKNKTKKEKPLPENLNLEAYELWLDYKGKQYSQQGKTLSANKLAKYSHETQMQMVENSIINNYKGLFDVEPKRTNVPNTKKTIDRVFEKLSKINYDEGLLGSDAIDTELL